MKKLFVILITLLLGFTSTKGQNALGWPLLPYNESGFTTEFIKQFVQAPTAGYVPKTALDSAAYFIRADWIRNVVWITNKRLAEAGMMQLDANGNTTNVPFTVDESNIIWILDHLVDSSVVLTNFTNSNKATKYSTTLNYYLDSNTFRGIVKVFRFRNISFILCKIACINVLDIPIQRMTDMPFQPGTTVVRAPNGDIYIYTYAQGGNATITNSGNSTNTNTATAGAPYAIEGNDWTRVPSYGGNIYPTRGVFQLGVNLQYGQRQQSRQPRQLQTNHASGPQGHDVTPGNSGGGGGHDANHASGPGGHP